MALVEVHKVGPSKKYVPLIILEDGEGFYELYVEALRTVNGFLAGAQVYFRRRSDTKVLELFSRDLAYAIFREETLKAIR